MTRAGKIRVLVVDDSAFMRKVLNGIITADPQLDVCGEAKDGREAVEQAETLKPDVISMDINMPRMDGLEATEIVMSKNPRPILIVSSESHDGAEVTLKALQLGAIDFVAKPSGGIDLDMSSVGEGEPPARAERPPAPPASPRGSGKVPIVVLACSTGGPATLMKMVPEFPEDFPAAVLQFAKQLAEAAQVKVKEAEAGEIILPGQVYVCPGACHMRVSTTGRIQLDDGPRIGGYRPCADLTLEKRRAGRESRGRARDCAG